MTNDLGEYRIFGLPAGSYLVREAGEGTNNGIDRSGTPLMPAVRPPLFFPAAQDVKDAAKVEVASGADIQGVDFILPKVGAATLSGKLVIPAAATPGSLIMMLTAAQEGLISEGSAIRGIPTKPDGRFELRGVTPGQYWVLAGATIAGKRYTARAAVGVSGDVSNLELVLDTGRELHGIVQLEDAPASLNLPGLRVVARPSEGSGVGLNGIAIGITTSNVPVDAEGKFTLANIVSDRYTVMIAGLPEGTFLKAASIGDHDVLIDGFDGAKLSAESLRIVLSGKAARLEGTVRNAARQPVAGATAVLIPSGARKGKATYYKYGNTDQNGRFTIASIDPGDYQLLAWEDVETGMWFDPDFVKPLEEKAISVHLGEGATEKKDLEAIPPVP